MTPARDWLGRVMQWHRTNGRTDPHAGLNGGKRAERDLAEMLGLAKGILLDGVVTEDEAIALRVWADDHPYITSSWPGDVLHERLGQIFEDGHASEEERHDLKELLEAIVGGEACMIGGETATTDFPIDTPRTIIEVPGRIFVLTGRFAWGRRRVCDEALRKLGGWPERTLTLGTDYLVIGTFGIRDWAQTSLGRKIEKAIDYRERYGRLSIISEDHWASEL